MNILNKLKKALVVLSITILITVIVICTSGCNIQSNESAKKVNQTTSTINTQAKHSNKINKPTEIKINLPENKKFIGLSTDPKHYLDSDNRYNELMIITKDITNNDYYVYRYEHDGTPINIDYELPIIIHENVNN